MNEGKNNKSGRFARLVAAGAGLGWAPPTLKPGGSSPAAAATRSTSGRCFSLLPRQPGAPGGIGFPRSAPPPPSLRRSSFAGNSERTERPSVLRFSNFCGICD